MKILKGTEGFEDYECMSCMMCEIKEVLKGEDADMYELQYSTSNNPLRHNALILWYKEWEK